MRFLRIKAVSDAYAASDCEDTMTVGELMDALRSYPEDEPVVLSFNGGYTFGNVKEYRIAESDEE